MSNMAYKSSIELLKEYASNSEMEISYNEIPYPEPYYRKNLRKYKQVASIFNKNDKTAHLVFFNDQYNTDYTSSAFFGAFQITSISIETQICFRKRDLLDRIKISTKKSGIKDFDSKFVLCNDSSYPTSLNLNNSVDLIYKSLNLYDNLHFSINMMNLSFIPELKDVSTIGIYQPDQWVTDKETLDEMYKNIKLINHKLTNAF